jgi:Uma2 family endonuclease
MTAMTVTQSWLPHGRPFTRDDLDRMPDDGNRYELIDGILIVSPSPRRLHQRVVTRLTVLLAGACPPDMEMLPGPFDVALAEDTVVVPDLLVARLSDLTERDLPTAPLLAVEVLSPSTRRIDRILKRARYEAAGTPSYWVVDPDEPSLTAWELRDGAYVEVATVRGDEAFEASLPFPVSVTPAALAG